MLFRSDPKTGELLAPRMLFTPAATSRARGGFEVETGIQAVGALLEFNREQPLCPLVNEPRLGGAQAQRTTQIGTGQPPVCRRSGPAQKFVDVWRNRPGEERPCAINRQRGHHCHGDRHVFQR